MVRRLCPLTEKMKNMLWTLGVVAGFYLSLCAVAYLFQEKLIFFPEKLSRDYQFRFSTAFKEWQVKTSDGITLHGLLFAASGKSKGLIFYLHGNAGSSDSWGTIAEIYTRLNYDLFILDYRGFGKSGGRITSESQFYADVQTVFAEFKSVYTAENIIIIAFSIGTAAASMLAANNHPKMLILQAPYYSLTDLTKRMYPFLPGFALKYKFKTHEFIPRITAPIVIFHGDRDEVIYYGSSLKLLPLLKPADKLITLKTQVHNGINENPEYIHALQKMI